MTTPVRTGNSGVGTERLGSVGAAASATADRHHHAGPRVPAFGTAPASFQTELPWGAPEDSARSGKSFSERGRELLCRHHLIRQQRLRAHRASTDDTDPAAPPVPDHNTRSKLHVDESELQFRSFRDLSGFLR